MNCYDCATAGDQRHAAAVCVDCGAAVCIEHAVWKRRSRGCAATPATATRDWSTSPGGSSTAPLTPQPSTRHLPRRALELANRNDRAVAKGMIANQSVRSGRLAPNAAVWPRGL